MLRWVKNFSVHSDGLEDLHHCSPCDVLPGVDKVGVTTAFLSET